MYKIYVDEHLFGKEFLIHNEDYELLKLDSPTIELELNQPSELKFSIFPNHPFYNNFGKTKDNEADPKRFKRMKSIVTVYRDEELIFRGRILENEDGFYKEKQVTCEGELAFFIDSQLRPYAKKLTPKGMLEYYVSIHNQQMTLNPEKQFVVGEVTITDGDTSNTANIIDRSNESIVSVWDEIKSKLLDSLGGYLIIDTDESGARRINWRNEDDFLSSSQSIDFGKNLINLKINVKGDEIATALIPIGGEKDSSTSGTTEDTTDEEITEDTTTEEETEETTETKEKLTIASLADGIVMTLADGDVIRKQGDYIYSEKSVEEYGWIFKTQNWDNVLEDVKHLLEVGIEKLNELKNPIESIEINAIDLYKLENVAAFELGTKINVTSSVHGLNGVDFPITKISLNLSNPASNTLTLAKTERTFTETSASVNKAQDVGTIVQRVETVINNASGYEEQIKANTEAIIETVEQVNSSIEQSSEQILTKVSTEYYLKDDAEALIKTINTELEQNNNSFEMRFEQFNADIENLANNTNTQFQQINKYIRFIDGRIVLGEEGNELTLNITNDRISFLQDNIEVAYFSNKEFKVVKGEFINQLTLGNFAFIPEEDGGLVFKKIK